MVKDCFSEALPEKSKRSYAAARIERWGQLGYNLGVVLASILLITSIAFVFLSPEPIAFRLLSLGFFGALPAVLALSAGSLARAISRLASEIYDPIAAASTKAFETIVSCSSLTVIQNGGSRLWRNTVFAMTSPIRIFANLLIQILAPQPE